MTAGLSPNTRMFAVCGPTGQPTFVVFAVAAAAPRAASDGTVRTDRSLASRTTCTQKAGT